MRAVESLANSRHAGRFTLAKSQLPLPLDQPVPSHRDMLLEIARQPNSALPSDLLWLVRESISLAEELDNGAHGGSS